MKVFLSFLCSLFFIFVIYAGVEAIDTSRVQKKVQEVKSINSPIVIFKCDGAISKGKIEKKKKDEKKQEEEFPPMEKRCYRWQCPRQTEVQDSFNQMGIPVQTEPYSITSIQSISTQVSNEAGKTLNKTCECSFEPQNKQTKKPLIGCKCSGQYKEPKTKGKI